MPNSSAGHDLRRRFDDQARDQDQVLSRAQLAALGISPRAVRTQLRSRRWQLVGSRAVVLHGGPPSRVQQCWAAVLSAGPRAALCGLTAAELDGLSGYDDPTIHILVPRGVYASSSPGVRVHESRRFDDADVHPARRPPRTHLARSIVDAAVWSPSPDRACALLAASVQQRLVTAGQLRQALLAAGAVRHRAVMLAALGDVEGGSHSLAEIDMMRLCRRAGLPTPQRQALRTDDQGRRRYLDLFWPDRGLCVEVDGAFHLDVEQWRRDLDRQNEVVAAGTTMLRFTSTAMRLDPGRVVEQLRRVLLPDDDLPDGHDGPDGHGRQNDGRRAS